MLTFYQHFTDRKVEEIAMTFSARSTIEKNRKKVEIFQNKRVSSQQIFEKEGATVAATPLPFLSGQLLRQAGPAAFYNELPKQWERVINYRKCPNYETLVIFRQQFKQKDAAESENRLKT